MKKRGYEDYKNVDDLDYVETDEVNDKSNTLELYSDDMARSAVSSLYKGIKDKNQKEKEEVDNDMRYSYTDKKEDRKPSKSVYQREKSTKDMGSTNLREPVRIVRNEGMTDVKPVVKEEPINRSGGSGDRGYTGFSTKNVSYDHKKSVFSTERIQKVRNENGELERNKAELSKIEEEKLKREKVKNQKNNRNLKPKQKASKNQQMVSYIRIGTIMAFAFLLILLTISTFQKASLNKKVADLETDIERYTVQLEEASGKRLQLESELDEYKARFEPNVIVDTVEGVGTDIIVTDPAAQGGSNNAETAQSSGLPTTHVVQPGDTLSSISAKYYNGDSTKYDKIMSASGMTSTDLKLDQVLTIPQ